MNTSSHISLGTLADVIENRATPATLQAVRTHVATCSECGETLQRLERLIIMMRSDAAADAPRDLLMSAIKLFPPGAPRPLRRIVATLIFDSRKAMPVFGMRSVRSSSRQLLYSAQQTDLDLRITIQNDECIVAGQVIREGYVGGLVEISGPTGSAEASLNELCEFTLPALPTGNYSLKVRMSDVEIEIPEL
ncbi:MAG TPA: hypothetical protein VFR80_01905, partial [Pyrinomonadaceae bacterium]|nr:hypothetical protein [Pyrinomonadaceae bacterium]